jgi:hypothetical protein
MPSRTLTNPSVDEEAIPGEDTSEVCLWLGPGVLEADLSLGYEAFC